MYLNEDLLFRMDFDYFRMDFDYFQYMHKLITFHDIGVELSTV